MNTEKIAYWRDTIRMCEEAMNPRAKKWRNLIERLAMSFNVDGVKNPVRINRFYKITREIIASVAFRHPYIYVKAEDDPADPETQEILEDASPILEDFANDALEIMHCKECVKQIIFDTLFCFRGWRKIGFCPPAGMAPYVALDDMEKDFTYIERIDPTHMLTDPLVQPHNFRSSRFVIQVMYPSIDDVIADPRFEKFRSQLKGLTTKRASSSTWKPPEGLEPGMTEEEQQTLMKAHRLANTRVMHEIHDRLDMSLIVFIDGIDEPIEEKDHPFVFETTETEMAPDPLTGKQLIRHRRPVEEELGDGVKGVKKWLVQGGFQFDTMQFDVSDQFYGTSIMEYENPIQNAIIRAVSRKIDLANRFKRLAKLKRSETTTNPSVVNKIREAEDGESIILDDLESLSPLDWGNVPSDRNPIERDMLAYEAETIRTSAGNADTATASAIGASESEMNRAYNQDPVEILYINIVRDIFSILSDPRFAPQNHDLRLSQSDQAKELKALALQAWMLRGKYNINTAVGSANILYEALQEDKTLRMVNMLRGSPNIKDLELDKYIIRAHGEMDADKLLKPDANVDASKAVELENQIMMTMGHDPGVTQGEDHKTHLALQDPRLFQQHPRFQQLQPEQQQLALRINQQHVAAHEQMQQTEASRFKRPEGTGGSNGRPGKGLLSLVQSNAQKTQDVVSKEAEEAAGRP